MWFGKVGIDVMMLSLSFSPIVESEVSDGVLNLFKVLVDEPTKVINYSSEIIEAGLKGRIALNSEFNIDAYMNAIESNTRLRKHNDGKKVRSFNSVGQRNDDSSTYYTEVFEEDIAKLYNTDVVSSSLNKVVDAYEQLLNEDELKFAIESINMLQEDFILEEKVDLLGLVKSALGGIPSSIKHLKELCEEHTILGENIKIVLESGREFNELFFSQA